MADDPSSLPVLDIDADITRAHTPPGWLYTDPGVYGRIAQRVFAPSWQIVATADDLRRPGWAHPATLLEGLLDEPLVLVRDEDDVLRCLSNVCTHRANLVVEAPGRVRTLRCGYHGRRFGLDGAFRSMPRFEGVEGFPTPCDNLQAVACDAFGPVVLASLGPGDDLDRWLGPVRERIGWMDLAGLRPDPARSRDYLVRCNWALYCENYLEGFHIPFVHPGLNEALDEGAYHTELFEQGVLQLGIAAGGESAFELPASSPDHGQRVAAYYYWLFPNLMLNFYPWGLSVNIVRPIGIDRTRVSFVSFVGDAARLDEGAGADLDRVEREDESVVELIQRGVGSRLYSRGRYSPTHERGVHHFHRLLADRLNG